MSTLYITQKYYDKFLETDSKKVIQLYGFKDRNIYFDSIIKFLNSKYSFLKIENLQIMPHRKQVHIICTTAMSKAI